VEADPVPNQDRLLLELVDPDRGYSRESSQKRNFPEVQAIPQAGVASPTDPRESLRRPTVPVAIAPGILRCAEFLVPLDCRGLLALDESAGPHHRSRPSSRLPDSCLKKGARITEYARHVPDDLVRCTQIDTGPETGKRIRCPSQCLLSTISDRRKKMFQQASLGINSSIITFGVDVDIQRLVESESANNNVTSSMLYSR
jgi:hypothetical protein